LMGTRRGKGGLRPVRDMGRKQERMVQGKTEGKRNAGSGKSAEAPPGRQKVHRGKKNIPGRERGKRWEGDREKRKTESKRHWGMGGCVCYLRALQEKSKNGAGQEKPDQVERKKRLWEKKKGKITGVEDQSCASHMLDGGIPYATAIKERKGNEGKGGGLKGGKNTKKLKRTPVLPNIGFLHGTKKGSTGNWRTSTTSSLGGKRTEKRQKEGGKSGKWSFTSPVQTSREKEKTQARPNVAGPGRGLEGRRLKGAAQ